MHGHAAVDVDHLPIMKSLAGEEETSPRRPGLPDIAPRWIARPAMRMAR
jgi:hypothetical protein